MEIAIEEISDFPDHPFKVRMDEEMQNLVESVRKYGVLSPALVRTKPELSLIHIFGRLHCPTWKRVFSARVFRDSKRFQTSYEDRVVKVLREYSDMPDKDVMTNEQILKAYGIISYTQTLECKGTVLCRTDTGQTFDTGDFPYGAVLNSQTMEHAKPVNIAKIRRIMTIENKANYENMSYKEDTLYIYCHGFFSPKEVEFLRELTVLAAENVEFLHWGDMDYGGIRIFLFNKDKIFPGLKPYKMDCESFVAAVTSNAGRTLEAEKRKKLEQMNAGELEEPVSYTHLFTMWFPWICRRGNGSGFRLVTDSSGN